jgi:hypothetical protein
MIQVGAHLTCEHCARDLKVIAESKQTRSLGICGQGYCSATCYQISMDKLKSLKHDRQSETSLIKDSSLNVCLEECPKIAQAEFIFFLHLLRSISECDIMKLILSRDSLVDRFHALKLTPNKKAFADFIFSTDIMKLALKVQMPADRTNYVVSRLWEIAGEAREKLMGSEEDGEEQMDFVDREIFQAIAKTAIDNILDLGTENSQVKDIGELEASKSLYNSQATNGKESMIKENSHKSELHGLYFLELEEDPLKRATFTVKDNGGNQKRIIITSEEPDFSDVTFKVVADKICNEDLLPSLDFVFVKRYQYSQPEQDEIPTNRFSVIEFEQRTWVEPGEEIFLAHSLRPGVGYSQVNHFVLNLNFPTEYFVKEADYFFYLHSPAEASRLQDVVSSYLCREFLPIGSKAKLSLRISNLEERLTALRDLCISHMSDHKVVFIEVLPSDIMFEAEDEETIYSQEEIERYKTCEQEVRNERFLLNLALKACLDLSTLRMCLQSILCDKSLSILPDQKADMLRIYRCLRIVRLLSNATAGYQLHNLSFVFAALVQDSENQTTSTPQPALPTYYPQSNMEYEIIPEEARWLLKLLGSTTLPKILCFKHDMSVRGRNILQMLLKPEVILNSRAKYELKAVLQTEFDPRGVCTCVSIKEDIIRDHAQFSALVTRFMAAKPPKVVTLLFELQTHWLLLENQSA